MVAQNDTAGIRQLLRKLKRSVRDGTLQVFRFGSAVRYEPGVDEEGSASSEGNALRPDLDFLPGCITWVDEEYDEKLREVRQLLPDNLEAYWEDLNAWLIEHEPRLRYKFPDPANIVAKNLENVRGLTKQQVIAAFEGLHFVTDAQWSKALADIPKWLEPCRVMKGKRGSKNDSALWDPIQIAAALLDKGISINKLDSVFKRLSDWADEWYEKTVVLRH